MVEPGDPFQGGQFDGFAAFPRRTAMDPFGLVQAVDRLSQCIVAIVAKTAH